MSDALRVLRGRWLPWWAVLGLGVAAVVVGVWLTAEPFRSLSVLVALVAAGLVLTGLGEIAVADESRWPWLGWLVGAVWIVAGVVAAAWPGLTVLGLAIAVGIGLLVGGDRQDRDRVPEQRGGAVDRGGEWCDWGAPG